MRKIERNTTGAKATKGALASWQNAVCESWLRMLSIDAYTESEQCTGLFTMIESHLALPFETELLRVTVSVERIDFRLPARLSRFAVAALSVIPFPSLIYHFRSRRRPERNGSRHTACGRRVPKSTGAVKAYVRSGCAANSFIPIQSWRGACWLRPGRLHRPLAASEYCR